ncbi:gas vesicle protein [Peterkaempfera bronchialis]|uniref:Gas vesicle protein n=1 Tax=Peterkaempfera bronchialis TaxID=2126346 RepID=A0A345T5S5_9ACTN|nr:gas vesicle protein [Peterkaempfera bronchialis]
MQSGAEPDRRRPRTTVTTREAAAHAALHVQTLTGRDPEGVTSLERTEGGWRIGIEVLEAHRIPDSTDILAEYQVEVDGDGELITYHRTRRYYRGRAEEG